MRQRTSAPAAGSAFSRMDRSVGITEIMIPKTKAILSAIMILTWGVPFSLALLEWGGRGAVAHSVLVDAALHARFLVAMPLLILAAHNLDARLEECRAHFLTLGIIAPDKHPDFDAVSKRFAGLRAPLWAVIAGIAFAYASAVAYALVFGHHIAPAVGPNWHLRADDQTLSLAGWWHLLISQPAYAFAFFWLAFRVGVVWWLFFRLADLELRLNPFHGDGAAGLGFLRTIIRPLSIAAFAVSASAAGSLADLLLYADAAMGDYIASIGLFALLSSIVLAGPLTLFSPAIRRERRLAILDYGAKVQKQADHFRAASAAQAAGSTTSADAGSLSFSNEVFATVQRTRPLILRVDVLQVASAAVVPFAIVATLQLPVDMVMQHLRLFLQ